MRTVIITVALLVAASFAYADQREKFIDVQHDAHRGATCYILNNSAISCVPDSQLKNVGDLAGELRRDTETLAGDEREEGPTPARTPTPRQHHEAFQL